MYTKLYTYILKCHIIMNNNLQKETILTRKRCPKGERWDKKENRCKKRTLKRYSKNDKCSKKYEPTTLDEIQRMNELKDLIKQRKIKNKDLINMVSDLIGEERDINKNQILGARMTDELISLIICLENKNKPQPSESKLTSEPPSKSQLSESESPSKLQPSESEPPSKSQPSESEPPSKLQPSESELISDSELKPNDKIDTQIQLDEYVQDLQNNISKEPDDIDSKEYNNYLFNKEKIEYNHSKDDNSYDFLYPDLNDPEFSKKIAIRKEFNDTKFDGKIENIKEQAEILCKADFELLPHQMFVKNFLSLQTPYNSLLLYHGLGTGKTCSAIGIAEEMRNFMKQVGITQKILIVASPNVQNNFRLQLFNEQKLILDGEQWNLNTCVGNSLIKEINPTNLKGITKDKIISLINSIINKYYSFIGYTELANYIQAKTNIPINETYTAQQRKQLKLKRIQKYFDNRLIIIDEVHNIRQSDDNKDKKKTSSLLLDICKYANNLRLLLLSATPMYNSYKEIIWLTNIMNTNDNRSTIDIKQVFDNKGNFIESYTDSNGNIIEGGRELLMRKLTGYISFVRGENPYSFPYRIYPDTFDNTRTINEKTYPTKQLNDKPIEEPLKYISVYTNTIDTYQFKGYKYIIQNMKNVNMDSESINSFPTFENMESFGYTQLERPLQALDIIYPNKELDKIINNETSRMSPDDIIKQMVGKNGLMNIMKYKTTEYIRYKFEYKDDAIKNYGRIFSPSILPKYSAKISSICNTIMKSKGIIIVYSQYIDGGVVPVALALEELGFTRYGSSQFTKPLFSNPPTDPIDSISMKPKSQGQFKQAKYVMITGDKLFSPNNLEDIKYITNSDNKNGENVKVILITKAAAEGLDFKNVRQVHIMEPWYNTNRIEQIIGRGVRNLSHCDLPFEQRNVEIYLHTISPQDDEEPADLYVYRFAEKKATLIGNVSRALKEISVDCHLNIEQTNFTVEKLTQFAENQNIKIELSSKPKQQISFKIGDKPFSAICDYQDNCNYQCSPNITINDNEIIKHTYSDDFARINFSAIIKRIRELFKEQFFYKRDDLINSINIIKKYPKEQIDFALTRFVNNKNEIIVDKYGRNGYLINKDVYYIFQPMEITDEYASLIERSIPVQFKRKSLKHELPIKPSTEKQIIETTLSSYETLIQTLTQNINNTMYTQNIKSGDNDWYKHYNHVHQLLIDNDFSKEQLYKYVIHHFLDLLPIQDKMTVINHIFQDNNTTLTKDEKIIKDYFKTYIVNDDSAIILFDVVNKSLPFQIYTLDKSKTPIWNKVESSEFDKYKPDLKNFFIADKNKINKIFGFIDKDNKNNIIFKTRMIDDDNQRNISGFNCNNAGKKDVIKKINDLPINLKIDYKDIKQQDTCIIFELIFRKLDEEKYNGCRWLFDKVIRNKNGIDTFIGKPKN